MGGIAAIAKSLGHKVTGSDKNVYPPMSTQLEALGIELTEGYCKSQFDPAPDMVVIGNATSEVATNSEASAASSKAINNAVSKLAALLAKLKTHQ